MLFWYSYSVLCNVCMQGKKNLFCFYIDLIIQIAYNNENTQDVDNTQEYNVIYTEGMSYMHMQLQISVFWHLVITEYFQQQYYWYYIVSVSKCIRIWDALRSEIMSQNDKVPSWDQWVVGYILCSMYKCIYCGGLLLVFFYLFHIKSHQISPFTMLNF